MTKIKITTATLLATGISLVGVGATARQVDRTPKATSGPEAPKPSVAPTVAATDTTKRKAIQEVLRIVTANSAEPSVFTLIAIAKAQAKVGDRAAAIATLEFAVRVADKRKPVRRADALVAIAYAHWEVGERKSIPEILGLALADVEQIEDEGDKRLVLLWVGQAQSWTGDIRTTRETIRRMREMTQASPQEDKFHMLMAVVQLQTIVGDYDDALRVIDSVADDHGKKNALLGEIATAGGSANHHYLQPPRELTPAQKKARLQGLRRILESYPDPSINVAIALGKLGETEEALKIAQRLDGMEGRRRDELTSMPLVLIRIGMAQADAGRPDAAKKTFHEAVNLVQGDPEPKSRLQLAAWGLARSGDVEGALRTATTLNPSQRCALLIRIAEVQAKAGASSDSAKTLRLALEDARTYLAHPPLDKPGTRAGNADYWKSNALFEIAMIESRLGNFAAALTTVREMPEARRGEALAEIAKEQTRSGKVEEVLTWVSKLDRPDDRRSALGGLAEGLAGEEKAVKPVPTPK